MTVLAAGAIPGGSFTYQHRLVTEAMQGADLSRIPLMEYLNPGGDRLKWYGLDSSCLSRNAPNVLIGVNRDLQRAAMTTGRIQSPEERYVFWPIGVGQEPVAHDGLALLQGVRFMFAEGYGTRNRIVVDNPTYPSADASPLIPSRTFDAFDGAERLVEIWTPRGWHVVAGALELGGASDYPSLLSTLFAQPDVSVLARPTQG